MSTDFGDSPNPIREHSYFVSGRYLLPFLVPILAAFSQGFLFLTRRTPEWVRPAVLPGLLGAVGFSEIALMRDVWPSRFNWFHLPAGY